MKKMLFPALCLTLAAGHESAALDRVLPSLPPTVSPAPKAAPKTVPPKAVPPKAVPPKTSASPGPAAPAGATPDTPAASGPPKAPPVPAPAVSASVPVPGISKYQSLEEYSKYSETERPNQPKGYIQWLKANRFKAGELDNLPQYAVILHAPDVPFYLGNLGIPGSRYKTIDLGSSHPNLLFVVERPGSASFIVNRGLPGAGGITKQTAELGALGVKYVIHIGTCDVLGPVIKDQSLILANGSYKDGAAVMLSTSDGKPIDPIATPDAALTARLETLLRNGNEAFAKTVGYTSPIFYFRPSGLMLSLFDQKRFSPAPRPAYIEMEQAPFFVTAQQMRMSAASLLIGTDRYMPVDGRLEHNFIAYDPVKGRERALRIAVRAFDELEKAAVKAK